MGLKIQCPAKINLFLEVTGKRRDGYHTLSTLFAKINLYDVLEFSQIAGRSVELEASVAPGIGSVGAGPDNLVLKAARGFYRLFHIGQGVKIHLTKKIPIGAGLGGGSSDAAGTLKGLLHYFKIKPTLKQKAKLKKLGASLGADVPFFLNPAPFCLGTGVGDKLKAVHIKKSLPYLILIYPRVPISTAKAYQTLPDPDQASVLTRLSQLDRLLSSLKRGRPVGEWADFLFNRLEGSKAAEGTPIVLQARGILEGLGAKGVRMSGSGSSVFGFVSSHEKGEAVLKSLSRYPWSVFLSSCQG